MRTYRVYCPAFLSTLSLRRATFVNSRLHSLLVYFYPRSPCGERQDEKQANQSGHCISIHALLAESDEPDGTITDTFFGISIHALLAESDDRYGKPVDVQFVFLSTLSLRRATDRLQFIRYIIKFLSTLSLRRATHQQGYHQDCQKFLSTLSLRRATGVPLFYNNQCQDFYPRSPCGERPSTPAVRSQFIHFYPRSPCGERLSCAWSASKLGDFYPRSPCGERHWPTKHHLKNLRISIHALLAESDRTGLTCGGGRIISIHALLAESDILGNVVAASPM